MTLDRDAARALFDNAAPMPVAAGGSASPFAPAGNEALTARMSGLSARKGPDWRLVAPVGVAALCAGVVLVVVSQRDDAEPGKTVASSELTRPLPAPAAMPAPVEMAAVTPQSPKVEPQASRPASAVRAQARTAPARRAPAVGAVVAAPSAPDASANVSAREPYVPPPVLVAPTPVIIIPAPPPPVITLEPEPQPVTPQPQPQPPL